MPKYFFLNNPTSKKISAGRRPFRIIFKTDADEYTFAASMANMDEQAAVPGGIIGFQLMYWQEPCAGAPVG